MKSLDAEGVRINENIHGLSCCGSLTASELLKARLLAHYRVRGKILQSGVLLFKTF